MNEKKKVIQTVKFNLAVGDAKPGPVLAPILGQSQINIQTFCKEFIELTQNLQEGVKLPVKIKKYIDKSFKTYIQAPTINYIYEQIVMSRHSDQTNNFKMITIFEILDILAIRKHYADAQNAVFSGDILELKMILSFLKTKNIKIQGFKK
jgi:ribosomal protein L11